MCMSCWCVLVCASVSVVVACNWCMCVRMGMCMNAYMGAYVYAYVRWNYTYGAWYVYNACIVACMHACMLACVYICVRARMYVRTRMRMHAMYVCMVVMCACM